MGGTKTVVSPPHLTGRTVAAAPDAPTADLGVGTRLTRAMTWAGVRPSTLAETLGVARGTVARWRAGDRPDATNLQAVSRALDVSHRWLVAGVGSMHDLETAPPRPALPPRPSTVPRQFDPPVAAVTAGVTGFEPERGLLLAILEVAQADQQQEHIPMGRRIALLQMAYAAGQATGASGPR